MRVVVTRRYMALMGLFCLLAASFCSLPSTKAEAAPRHHRTWSAHAGRPIARRRAVHRRVARRRFEHRRLARRFGERHRLRHRLAWRHAARSHHAFARRAFGAHRAARYERRTVRGAGPGAPLEIRPAPQIAQTNLIAQAERYVGDRNPTGFRGAWCGAFMGMVARRSGHAPPPGYLQARSWAHAGRAIAGPAIGAVAVMRHHVGIVVGFSARGPILISGNHGHRVGVGVYSASGIIGYRALS